MFLATFYQKSHPNIKKVTQNDKYRGIKILTEGWDTLN